MDELPFRLDPRIAAALAKAERFHALGCHDLAEHELRAALHVEPDSPALHTRLGWALELQGRLEEAEQQARRALALDPDEVGARVLIGRIRTSKGRYREAERIFRSALHLAPDDPHLQRFYSALLHRTGRLEEAERLLRRSLALAPENPETHSALALVLAEKRERGSAARFRGGPSALALSLALAGRVGAALFLTGSLALVYALAALYARFSGPLTFAWLHLRPPR
jgi:Tfp pilus assembly protein PilF